MTPQNEKIIPAAMHQWFSGGEAWTCHPDLADSQQLLQGGIVKEQLNGRKTILQGAATNSNRGVFTETLADGRTLLGVQEFDPNCPDPKAVDRFPTKMWVAVLPAPPKRGELDSILRQLRSLSTHRPGVDRNLQLSIDISKLERSGVLPPEPKKKSLSFKLIITMGIILALAVGVLFCEPTMTQWPQKLPWPKIPSITITGTGEPDFSDIVVEMEKIYDIRLGSPPAQNSQEAKINVFFELFSQEKWLKGKAIDSKHPDALLLGKLPKRSLHPPEGRKTEGYTKAEVTDQLKKLVRALYPNDKTIDEKSPEEWVRMTRDFLAQFYTDPTLYIARPDENPAFPWDEEIPREVQGFSDFVRKLSTNKEAGTTPKEYGLMLKYLRDRGVKGLTEADLESRPEVVVRSFVGFHTLSVKPEFFTGNSTPPMLFLKTFSLGKIPSELFADTLPEEKELKGILEKHFSIAYRPGLDHVIGDIEKKFTYDMQTLQKNYSENYTDKMQTSDLVQKFVGKYCKGSKAEFNTGDFDEYEAEFKKLGIVQLIYDKNKLPAYSVRCIIPEQPCDKNVERFVERFKPASK